SAGPSRRTPTPTRSSTRRATSTGGRCRCWWWPGRTTSGCRSTRACRASPRCSAPASSRSCCTSRTKTTGCSSRTTASSGTTPSTPGGSGTSASDAPGRPAQAGFPPSAPAAPGHPTESRMAIETDAPSTALITNDIVVFGLISATLGLIFWLASGPTPFWKKFFAWVPALLLCYFVPAIYNTVGLIDGSQGTIYNPIASRVLLPVALVLLTMTIDLRGVLRLGPKLLF